MKRTGVEWNGKSIHKINLISDEMQVDILDFGGVVQRISWRSDAQNLCLGYETVEPYFTNPGKLGAIVGRYANRINNARAIIDGDEYLLDANNGAHCLHGGHETLGLRLFDILEFSQSHVVLFQSMPNGHMGFPGALDVWVTYRLNGSTLALDIQAKTDATTLCNITGHSYFNFSGEPTFMDHQLRVVAQEILDVDTTGIPTGHRINVAGTHFDFKELSHLSHSHKPVNIDHNYCVSQNKAHLRPIAWLLGGDTAMELASTEPGLQVYTGSGLGAELATSPNGRAFHPFAGIALEPQIWPDSPNQPKFAQAVLRPDDTYHHQIEYRFRQRAPL